MENDILLQKNGKPWLTTKNKTIPQKCPICGADMRLFLIGSAFVCSGKDRHYYGELKFNSEGGKE